MVFNGLIMPINFNKASPCYKIKDHDDLKLPAKDFTSIAFFKIPYDDTEFNETRVNRIHDLGIIYDKEYKDYIAGIDNSNIEKDRNEYERLKKIFEPPKTKE